MAPEIKPSPLPKEFMTQETPVKVLSLLGTAIASLFFLFAVTVSNASFEKMETPFPDTFAPANVMAMLDTTANSYAKFVEVNLVKPGQQDYAFYADNISYLADEVGPVLLSVSGLQGLADAQVAAASAPGQVAGASDQIVVSKYYPSSEGAFSIFYK